MGDPNRTLKPLLPDDVEDYFMKKLQDGSLCTQEFMNRVISNGNAFIASDMLLFKLADRDAQAREGRLPPPAPIQKKIPSLKRVFSHVKSWVKREKAEKQENQLTQSDAGSDALVQESECFQEIRREYMKELKKSLKTSGATFAGSLALGAGCGTGMGFLPGSLSILAIPFFLSGDYLLAESGSQMTFAKNYILGHVPGDLGDDTTNIKHLALASYFSYHDFIYGDDLSKKNREDRIKAYRKSEMLINKLADLVNFKYTLPPGQRITADQVKEFFHNGIQSGFLCKKEFSDGMKKGKLNYLTSLIVLSQKRNLM
jgi:hypothetical protein